MADQARVTSLEALETFRASLIIFLNKAHTRVDEVGDEVRRTRSWIQNEQRLYWEGQIRRLRKILDQAQQELHAAKLSSFQDNVIRQMMAMRKAKQAVDDAEEKLRKVKLWSRNFDTVIAPQMKKLESLRGVLDYEMPKAIAYLMETQKILEAYTETSHHGVLDSPSVSEEPPDEPSR